jgi:hypothetical protein
VRNGGSALTPVALAVAGSLLLAGAAWMARSTCRRFDRRRYVRLLVEPYRNDRAQPEALLASLVALHSLLSADRGSTRSLALEVHLDRRAGGAPLAWFALRCPAGLERHVEAALRTSYQNVRLRALRAPLDAPPAMVTMHRRTPLRASAPPRSGPYQRAPARSDSLLQAMAAAGAPATLELALRPASRVVEHLAAAAVDRSEPRGVGGQPVALFWAEPRVFARDAARAHAIASAVRSAATAPPLVASRRWRVTRVDALVGCSLRRSPRRLYRPEELSGLWELPSPDFTALPCVRRAVPLAPAPPGISRPRVGRGLLRDEHGGVTISLDVRRQHTAVVGAVEQGKSSYLVASAREDLARADCALIVLDPKGDAADAVLSVVVPEQRTCTLLDMSAPTCGFNPLAMAAAPDAVADYVVGALRGLFSEGEIRGSSDRYLRNAVIAALACEPGATLWHVARLLEVGEAGTAARAAAAERLIAMPSYAEVATFLAEELPVQLAAARATTTAKLDAPSNKLARLLNSPAVKRVLLNDSLPIDLDRVIDNAEVLVVRGALGEIGAGNVAVLMQLLLGMLDAALSRVQDRRAPGERRAVALKVDEAPLVINEGFAQTLALKRSAGLETVACWQTDAQWPIELRDQLDALFAHRVLFATASAADARAASGLLLSEFSDQLRPSDEQTMRLATPDVRLHLPRHTAIVSWTTPAGRERPFIATTLPMAVDRLRIARHAERQLARGARELRDPRPPVDLFAVQSPPAQTTPAPEIAQSPRPPRESSAEPPQSFAELCAVDASVRVRWLPRSAPRRGTAVDAQDRGLLEWLVGARCALSTQVHRRLRPGRALTTTQRQLKRLADAGLLARFQLHRPDGGGVPQCCVATAAAIELLSIAARVAPSLGDDALPGLLRDLHLVGWLLAFESCAAGAVTEVLGPGRAAITPGGGRGVSPADLVLAPGVRARDFLHGGSSTERRVVGTFAAVRPDAVLEVRLDESRVLRTDLLVVHDRDGDSGWLARFDHLVSGWWSSVPRYARHGTPPLVVVLCADAARAQERARSADTLLRATLARIGDDPGTWERPGRARIHFAAEIDVHAGSLAALRVPQLPPELRAGSSDEPLRVELLSPRAAAEPRPTPPPWR